MRLVIAHVGDGFELSIPGPTTGPTIDFTSRGVELAVPEADADYFRGSVFSANYDALFAEDLWWMENPNDLGRSGCSDPLGASCSVAKFRRFHPELFGLRGFFSRLRGGMATDDREQILARTSAYLRWGDGRAATVVQLSPLIVAAYCDEMDAAILLGFPDAFINQYSLEGGTPLVTANLHHRTADGRIVADIAAGPRYCRRFTNVRPLIADFVAAEEGIVEARRRTIAAAEYARCREFGERARRQGNPSAPGGHWRPARRESRRAEVPHQQLHGYHSLHPDRTAHKLAVLRRYAAGGARLSAQQLEPGRPTDQAASVIFSMRSSKVAGAGRSGSSPVDIRC